MGHPRFSRKKYHTPSHPWHEGRIKEENEIIKKYGLKNKREVWKAKSLLRNFRRQARLLFPLLRIHDPQGEKEAKQLLGRLIRLGILEKKATLDNVLALDIDAILSRRLQTLVYMKGLAHTLQQARQFIVHGHIALAGRRFTIPGYIVRKDEENNIQYYDGSLLNNEDHPMRLKIEAAEKEGVKKKKGKGKKELKEKAQKTSKVK